MLEAMAKGAPDSQRLAGMSRVVIAYYLLRDQTCYQDLGPDYFDGLNPEGLRRRLTKRLEGLGFNVTLQPLARAPKLDLLRNKENPETPS